MRSHVSERFDHAMCGLCGMLEGERHWTERAASPAIFGPAGSGAAGSAEGGGAAAGRPRMTAARERQERVRLVNRVLGPMGLVLAEWAPSSYVLRTKTGRSEMVPTLGDLWPAAERLLGRPCDPLDPALLARLPQPARPLQPAHLPRQAHRPRPLLR